MLSDKSIYKQKSLLKIILKLPDMKKFAFIFLIGIGFTFLMGCDSLLGDLGINVLSDYYETELTIPATDAGEYVISELVNSEDIETIIEENGYDPSSLINYVHVKNLVFEVMNESAVKDFSSVDLFEAFLSTDNLGETKIASDTNNGATTTAIDLNVLTTDVADYLNEEEIYCVGKALLNSPLTEDLKIKVKVRFEINIQAMEALEGSSE